MKKVKTQKEKDFETYLEQSVRNNAPIQYKQIKEAQQQNMMIVLESSDMKGDSNEMLQTIGMIIKYAAIQGVEVRVAPDGSLEEEEK